MNIVWYEERRSNLSMAVVVGINQNATTSK